VCECSSLEPTGEKHTSHDDLTRSRGRIARPTLLVHAGDDVIARAEKFASSSPATE
jgi:hypothetical protein